MTNDKIFSIESIRKEVKEARANEYFSEIFMPNLIEYVKSKIIFVFSSVPCVDTKDALFYDNNAELVVDVLSKHCVLEYVKCIKLLPSNSEWNFIHEFDTFLNTLIVEKMKNLEGFIRDK